jgi:hypothetical protein
MFCRSLSEGLHAAAQPLTILLAGLQTPCVDEMSRAELTDLVSSSAHEVVRVCALFTYLQDLVSTESVEPELLATPLLPLLAHAIEGVDLLFRESGIFLRSTVPDAGEVIPISSKRTLAALSSVLLVAHAVSHVGDTVEVIVTVDSPDSVQVVLRNKNAHPEGLNSEEGLSMALAEANVRSQRASLSWSLEPFSVLVAFPKGVRS